MNFNIFYNFRNFRYFKYNFISASVGSFFVLLVHSWNMRLSMVLLLLLSDSDVSENVPGICCLLGLVGVLCLSWSLLRLCASLDCLMRPSLNGCVGDVLTCC